MSVVHFERVNMRALLRALVTSAAMKSDPTTLEDFSLLEKLRRADG